jgi:hypothetical protein
VKKKNKIFFRESTSRKKSQNLKSKNLKISKKEKTPATIPSLASSRLSRCNI